MISKELYIEGKLVDIQDVNIIRKYTSPYFSDATKVFQNGTYTVTLPVTDNNCVIFGYANREDMFTDVPYKILTANYYVNGLPIFENAECKMLSVSDVFEVQFTWGFSKAKYLPLFTKKLNEIVTNGTTITDDDWCVNWNKTDMFIAGKKYKYIDYVSSKLTQDQETISGVIQKPIDVPVPFFASKKEMTMHPFISFKNVLDLIIADSSLDSMLFDEINSKIINKGIILSTLIAGKTYNRTASKTISNLDISSTLTTLPLSPFSDDYGLVGIIESDYMFGIGSKVKGSVTINFTARINKGHLKLYTNVTNSIDVPYTFDGVNYYYSLLNYDLTNVFSFYFSFFETASDYHISNLSFDIAYQTNQNNFVFYPQKGIYDCLSNLPKMTAMEFIQEALILSGGSIGSTVDGNFKVYLFDEFVNNLNSGNVTDWSGRVTPIQKGLFQFNSNSQKNYLKFANDKDLLNRNEFLSVQDLTIPTMKDLYNLKFNSPIGLENAKSENILYEQTVKKSGTTGVAFDNKYIGTDVSSIVKSDNQAVGSYSGTALNINIAENNYTTYQKLINRPIVKTVEVNLDFFESANIDFAKPIYIKEWGKYCLLLDITCPDNEVSAANLLIINEQI